MPDESDPPRKYYDFKPREFDRANGPGRPAEPLPQTPPPAPPAYDPTVPISVRELHRQASLPGPVLSRGSPPTQANEVHDILRDNLARENAAGLNEVPLTPPRASKRTRDYWLLMIGGNVLMGFLAVNALRTGNAIMFVYLMAGIGGFSAGITWIMWFVMDRY